jgi:hypothetical protein
MSVVPFISFTDIDIGDILYEIDIDNKQYGPILVLFSRGNAGFIGVETDDNDGVLITEYSDTSISYIRTGCANIDTDLATLMSRIQ